MIFFKYATILLSIKVMPYYYLKCYLLLKLASHLVKTMEICSTRIAFCVILGIVIMYNTIITV